MSKTDSTRCSRKRLIRFRKKSKHDPIFGGIIYYTHLHNKPKKQMTRPSNKLTSLIRCAKSASRTFNHKPTNARIHPNGQAAIIECLRPNCRGWVQVNTCPQPNKIDIVGPMIARNCPYRILVKS